MKTNLLKSIFISLILILGVSNAWGYTISSAKIYYDDSNSKWGSNVVVAFDKNDGGAVFAMTKINNTNLYYWTGSWGDGQVSYMRFGKTTKTYNWYGWWSDVKNTWDLSTTDSWSGVSNGWGLDINNAYKMFGAKSNSSGADLTKTDLSGYSALNYTQTIKTAVDGADANSKAAITVTSYNLTGNGTISSQKSASISTSAKSTTISAARTATTTLTVGSVATGYQFDGWYAAKTGGTAISTSTTYTYYPTAATTVYARFSTIKYTVNFGVHSSGNGTLTAKAGSTNINTGAKVNHGSSITFTVSPNPGYRVQGWYSDANCTNSLNNGTNTDYTINSLTTNANVYVKYEEIPEDKFDVTIQTNNANYGTVSPSGLQQVGASGINITATAETGYQFDEWTYTDGVSVEDASEPNTTASATKAGTVTANFSIKNYTITYNLNGGTNNTSNPASYTVETETITLQDPTKEGFLFAGWYTSSTFSGTAVTSITKGSTGNKTLYAKWLDSRDCIFFYNNLGWSNVYVYFYSSDKYWDDSNGTGSQKEKIFSQDGDADHKPHYLEYRGKMTKIEGTNIWYYNRSVHGDITRENYTTVAFTKDQQNNYEFFYETEVVRRSDFNSNVPMFVSMKVNKVTKNNNKTSYYNTGYWMNYPTNTGYKLHIFDKNGNKINDQLVDIPFEYGDNTIMPWSVSVSLEGATTYAFKIQRADGTNDGNGTWYGNNGTMTTNSSGNTGQTAWEFTTGTNNCKITTTAPGTYVFTLNYGKDAHNNYNYLVGVEYPASVGDYRLVYKDDTHPFHPGHLLKKRDGKDTVSFFVHHDQDLHPVIMLQKVNNINANTGAITWEDISTTEINGISATGIYNFILEQSSGEADLLNTITEYDGDFYIRTDATAGGWGNFRQKSNKMTYTSYAENQDFGFNHYFVKWINAGTNVKFTIANDYSYCLSDSLDADDIVTTGNLPANANVRFGWNSKTNELSRAYIAGSSNASDRFLVLTGNENLLDIAGKPIPVGTGDRAGLEEHELIFSDKQNWIYQLDVQANNNTVITLTAKYNNKVQTFIGTSKSGLGGEPIMQATNEDYHKVRMIYDFKTNNLIAAWLLDYPRQETEATSVASNMLIIREDQDDANQINFSNINNDDMTIQTAYAVMTFTRDHVTDKDLNQWQRSEYWVSFPFDVNISDVFGFSEYGDKWIMQLYDGAERAEKGNWIDSPTFWKYITNRNYTLKAGVGYVLKLNLNKMTFDHGATDVSLFFPSQGIPTVINAEPTSITVPPHECTIERDNRNIHDSHWNLIGVPGYANLNDVNTKYTTGNQAENVSFYYAYNAAENKYAPAAAEADFKNMYAYMVQFAGTIDWKNDPQFNNIPQQLAARRNSDTEPEKRTLRLEIAQGEEVADQTFIQLQQEGATAEFDMNLDLTKIINSGANIYTLAGEQRIQSAGNALPMGEAIVPVGVKIDAEGEYTFRMPDGTEGMVVELIDYERDMTTNLLLFDYTVTLPAGSNESRFALHIQPNKSGVTTGVEEAYPQPLPKGKGTKFLIDGKLVIRTAEGAVYDAQGHVVQ